MTPGTRVEFQPAGGPAERGTVLKPKRMHLPLPSTDWCVVRFDGGDALCVHRSGLTAR